MAQTVITARVNEGDKIAFSEFCEDVGMNISTAINMFVRYVAREGRLPFAVRAGKDEIKRKGLEAFNALRAQAMAGDFPEMTLDEINEEIAAARRDMDARK